MSKEKKMEKLIRKHKSEDKLLIFRTNSTHGNMNRVRFSIPQETSHQIVQQFQLPEKNQEDAVFKLVDRTPDWLDIEESQRTEEIKAVLVLETVAWYLYTHNYIQENCDMYENGFDEDGNIILDAFYIKKKHTKKQVDSMRSKKVEKKETEEKSKIISFPTKGNVKHDN